MMNNNDYQYNSCTSRGICSINPKTASLMQILILYLSFASYYALKIDNMYNNEKIKNLILNTISMTVSNPDFSENNFTSIIENFNKELPDLIKQYEDHCKKENKNPEYLKSPIKLNRKQNIVKSIQMGEKEFLKRTQSIPLKIRNLYALLLVLAKSLCTNILDLSTFSIEEKEGYKTILTLLNSFNVEEINEDNIKTLIKTVAYKNNELMHKLRNIQIKRYGEQREKEVSYSTTQGSAVLVVGSNIKELENILEALKSEKIDVYTHDEMLTAHTFPKFDEYKNLKGQYGQGMENCLLDFSTFPGPIILTRHSLYNVEHLYRGRLYTTDITYSKGVIPIINNDFSDVINSALSSSGFKTGKQCESEKTGFNYKDTVDKINTKMNSEKYKRIFFISLSGYNLEMNTYFNNLLNIIPDDTLVISMSYYKNNKNFICLNACFDALADLKLSEFIVNNCNLPITFFFPICDRHTISKVMYLSSKPNVNIYIGECEPITINPTLFSTLFKEFGINKITTPKKDIMKIYSE